MGSIFRGIALAALLFAASAPGFAQPGLSGARALIDTVYSAYVRDEAPAIEGLYTVELLASMALESDMEDGGLGYDPFCQCQDFGDFSYTIESLEPTAEGATATVAFSNFGEPQTVRIELVQRDGEWRVGDIHNGETSLLTGE